MATITLTQILGTDNVALSRPVINQNFSTIENALNILQLYLNTTPPGGALSIGSIQLNVGANSINDNIFVNQASGIFYGNLTINQDLTLSGGNLDIVGNLRLSNTLEILGTGSTSLVSFGSLGNPVDFYLKAGMLLDEQFSTTTGTPAHLETTTGVHEIDVDDLRIIYLDYSAWTGYAGETNKIRLIGTPLTGQRVFLRISGAPVAGGTFLIDTAGSGFSNIYTSDIEFVGASDSAIMRLWVEIVYHSSGWTVIGAHPLVNNI